MIDIKLAKYRERERKAEPEIVYETRQQILPEQATKNALEKEHTKEHTSIPAFTDSIYMAAFQREVQNARKELGHCKNVFIVFFVWQLVISKKRHPPYILKDCPFILLQEKQTNDNNKRQGSQRDRKKLTNDNIPVKPETREASR